MKKIIMRNVLLATFLLVFLLSFNFPGQAWSSSEQVIKLQIDSIELWMNGQTTEVMDVAPFLENNRTWVPVRFVSEALGAEVGWNQEKKQVTIRMEGKTLLLTIDSNVLITNGKSQTMDVAPFLRENRTWVPLRFVAENLGCTVSWVQASREVIIRRGLFAGPTVAYVRNGNLVMQEISGYQPQEEKVLAQGGVSGPLAWSFNGLNLAYYRLENLPNEFFNLTLEYVVESSGAIQPLLYKEQAYGGLKPLSWDPHGWYLLYDEPTSDVSGTLWLIMVELGETALLGNEGEVIYGVFSPDGIHMAWLAYDEEGISVQVWDEQGMKLKVTNVMGHFAWSPNGSYLACSTEDGITIYDVYNPALFPKIYPLQSQAYELLWSPDGSWIAGSSSQGVFALDLNTGDAYLIDDYSQSRPAGFLPSGELIIEHPDESLQEGNNYYILVPESGELLPLLKGVECLAVRPN